MKNKLFLVLALSLLLLAAGATIHSSFVSENLSSLVCTDVNAKAYVNQLPGDQGERQKQAVWCGGSGWNVQQGCCYGGENCTMPRCKKVDAFTCGDGNWLYY